jgi:hypothetical protein
MKLSITPLNKIKIDDKVFTKHLKKQMDIEAESMRDSHELTTKTWRHKPVFRKYVRVTENEVYLSVTTQDDIYRYIDQGTKVRYALMSKDWISKTKPRVLTPGGGRGHMVFVNKKIRRPGIKARKFSEEIWHHRKDRFTRDIQGAIGEAAVDFIKTDGGK